MIYFVPESSGSKKTRILAVFLPRGEVREIPKS